MAKNKKLKELANPPSDLCDDCAKKRFDCAMGTCSNCGAPTSSGGFKLCVKCAVKKKICAACGKPLT